MIIVAGTFDVAPERRAEFLEGRRELQLHSRTESGCVEYVMSADSLEPGRVRLFEIWTDEASLAAHSAANRERVAAAEAADPVAFAAAVPVLARDLFVYELTDTAPRPL
jgi:quinol monooxygenase YgiN